MTYIFVSKIPQTFDTQRSAESFKRIFSGEKNARYLETILQKKHPKAKAQSLFALEILARGLVSLKIDTSNLMLKKTPSGKPYFEGEKPHFSISHDANAVAVAICEQNVGIDIQSHRGVAHEQKIAERFFSEDECEDILSEKLDFLTVWTKREAYAKLTDTPLAALSKKEMSDDVFFQTFSIESSKISVATFTVEKQRITLFS